MPFRLQKTFVPRRAVNGAMRVLRSLVLLIVFFGWFSCLGVLPAVAQTSGGDRPAGLSPRARGFLTAYRFYLSGLRTVDNGNRNFSWDADIGADLDVFDLGFARANMFFNLESMIGNERRDIDPTQNNYTIDMSVFVRLPRGEIGTTFHHVSRHLSDRENALAVAWNSLGVTYMDRFQIGSIELEISGRALRKVLNSGVDYESEYNGRLRFTAPIDRRFSFIADIDGTVVLVDRTTFDRATQYGGLLEAGLQIRGKAGTAELIFGRERRIDADPFERRPIRWTRFGFRFVVE